MRGLCFIQDKFVKEWLIVVKWDHKKNRWIYPRHIDKIPYEVEDTRFLYALRYLDYGFKFYQVGAKLGSDYPVSISRELIEKGIEAWNSNPFIDDNKIDVSGFWQRVDLCEKPITKKESKKQLEINAKRKIHEIWQNRRDEIIPANSWLAN